MPFLPVKMCLLVPRLLLSIGLFPFIGALEEIYRYGIRRLAGPVDTNDVVLDFQLSHPCLFEQPV